MGQETRSLRILVTGGQGFLGGNLVRALVALGFEQVAATVRREAPELSQLGVEVVGADLTVAEQAIAATRNRDFIFHTAARAGVWGDYQSYHAINVEATRNLLTGASQHGARYFVHTSSPSVTFQGVSAELKTETEPYGRRPLNPYCATKIEAERLVFEKDWGFKVMALRPHLIYGPGDPHLLPRVYEAARRGRLVRVGNGLNQVDVTHIVDAVGSQLGALAHRERDEMWGEAYFISSGVPVRLWAWIAHLLQWRGLPPVKRCLPVSLAYGLGALLEILYRLKKTGEPPLTRFSALQLGLSHTFSIEKARRRMGYAPRVHPYSPFPEQFQEEADWTCFENLF
ncbi:MAG: NAD-dependent epimerase/dehydratase family protein [Vulcanimicrobiota bacterium]